MIVHAFNPNLGGRDRQISLGFEGSLVHIGDFRTVRLHSETLSKNMSVCMYMKVSTVARRGSRIPWSWN